MKILLYIVLVLIVLMVYYFIRKSYIGYKIGKCIQHIEKHYNEVFNETANRKVALKFAFKEFYKYPVINKLTESEKDQAIQIIEDADDPVYLLKYMFLNLTAKNLIKGIRNPELLREVVDTLNKNTELSNVGSESIIIPISLKKKADELVDSGRVLFEIIKQKILKEHPDLYMCPQIELFSTYGAIATAFLVCVHLHQEVDKDIRTSLELIVQKNLNRLTKNAENEYVDLNRLIGSKILDEKDHKNRRQHIILYTSLWILYKIGFITSVDKPNKESISIVNNIGDILNTETVGYWKTEK